MVNGMLFSTLSCSDKKAIDRFEMGHKCVSATNCSSLPLWHQSAKCQTAGEMDPHAVTSMKESILMHPFTSQWLDGINGLLEPQ